MDILSLLLSREGQLSVKEFPAKEYAQVQVNCLEDWACPGKVWLGKLTVLDMTLMGWLGRKTSAQSITIWEKGNYTPYNLRNNNGEGTRFH